MSVAALGTVGAMALLGLLVAGGRPPRRPVPTVEPPARTDAPPWVVEACRQLGWSCDPGAARRASLAIGGSLGGALALTWGIPGVVVSIAAAIAVPRVARRVLARRRLEQRDRQIPDAMERVAAALRAGSAPGPALVEVAGELEAPLGEELRGVARGLHRGEPLSAVLDRWARRHDASPAVVLAASALELGAAAGGHVARAVDGVAATLRERRQIEGEVAALATQARTSAWLLAAAPVAFAALVGTVEPGVVRFLVATPLGLVCLALGAALDGLGLVWMGRIVRGAS